MKKSWPSMAMVKLKDYMQLMKFTLSFTVVFSCVVCYLLAPDIVEMNWKMMGILSLAGMLVTGSANAINQAEEKNTDAVMKRTAARPVAAGRMKETEAWTFATITGVVGLIILYKYFNPLSAIIAAVSLVMYSFVYTPLKKINSIAVLVGAFPGALPCLIGWVAGTNELSTGGWILFGMQFLWQFPHFWAIAWVAHLDYTKAGFKLLPSDKGPTKFTAIQAIIYAALMIPVGILPYIIGMSGVVSFGVVLASNLFIVWQCVRLY
ncbi:MAG TPA: heme o synthase, partial [Chitinophagaceae bacterium]|nr:heme o synthase [Chitinophagaceae bacterium]